MTRFTGLVARGDGDDWFSVDLQGFEDVDGYENPYYVCAQFDNGSRTPLPIILNDTNADPTARRACEDYEDAAVSNGHWDRPAGWNSRRYAGDPSDYGRVVRPSGVC